MSEIPIPEIIADTDASHNDDYESPREIIVGSWPYFLGLFAFLIFGATVMLVTDQGDFEFAFNRYRTPLYDTFWRGITQLAEEYIYILGIVVLAAFSYRKAMAFGLLAILVVASSGVLKAIFGAPRPNRWFFDYANELWEQLFRFDEVASSWAYTSFPSGHATSAFAIYGFLTFTMRGRARLWVGFAGVLIAIAVAFSRQYLLFHFMKDVTAGAALGALLAMLVYLWQQRWWPESKRFDHGYIRSLGD